MRHLRSLFLRAAMVFCSAGLVVSSLTLVSVAQAPKSDDEPPAQEKGLVGNKSAKTYHKTDCALIRKLPGRSRVELASPEAAQAAGFKPCATCKPATEGDAASMPLDDDSGLGAEVKKSKLKKGKGGTEAEPEPTFGIDNGPLKFSRDIAPILAGNCMPCHKDMPKQGEFNLSTFQKLLEGSQSGPVLVPGKAEESLLVQLVTQRKMPRGGNRRLSNEAIARIQRWVAEGATLDAGVSPTDSLDKIKPSPEQIRRESLAKLSPAVRDAQVEKLGLERLKKGTPQAEPKVLTGKNLLIFHAMPEERAKTLLRTLETQRTAVLNLIGNRVEALTGPEKLSVYVVKDANAYTEFVRSVEQREVEMGTEGHARLNADAPYLVVTDHLAGGEETAAPAGATKKATRKKNADDLDPFGPPATRTLAGVATEALTSGALAASGKAPRWLSEGLGAYMASQVEPRSPYYTALRTEALQQLQLGWETRSGEVLNDQGSPAVMRAMGFTLCQWIGSTGYRQQFPMFVRALTDEGAAKFDDILKGCFGTEATRQAFQTAWGEFVATSRGGR